MKHQAGPRLRAVVPPEQVFFIVEHDGRVQRGPERAAGDAQRGRHLLRDVLKRDEVVAKERRGGSKEAYLIDKINLKKR